MDSALAVASGAPSWGWLGLGLVLLSLEVAIGSVFLIGPGVAAVTLAIVTALTPMNANLQWLLFSALSVGVMVAAHRIFARRRPLSPRKLNNRAGNIVGQVVKAVAPFEDGVGSVVADGVRWRALLLDADRCAAGASLLVERAGASELHVRLYFSHNV